MKRTTLFLAAVLILLPLIGLSSAAPEFTTGRELPDAMQGVYYTTQIKAGGSGSVTFSFVPGEDAEHSLPKGLTMNENGLIYGTPRKAGTYKFVVEAADKAASAKTTDTFTLTVMAFGDMGLNTGGADTRVTGTGFDDLTGVANAPNGGKAAMGYGWLFYVDAKGYLMESAPPFRNAKRAYGAVEYDCLDTLGKDLYYFNRYLSKKEEKIYSIFDDPRENVTTITKKQYVQRIIRDSIGKKGRDTLVVLKKRISNLSVTNELVLYIQSGLLKRADLKNGKVNTMRAYVNGREMLAGSAFPYNGYAYFTGKDDRLLYRMPLSGQTAQLLTDGPVTAYTAALFQGGPALYYSNAAQQLYRAGLDGSSPQALEGLRAAALNADKDYVYFINPMDSNRVYRLKPESEIAERLSETPAKSIYVFDTHIAFETQTGNVLFFLPKDGGDELQFRR